VRRLLLVVVSALLASGASTVAAGVSAPGVVTGRVWRDAKTIQCVRAPCLEPAPGVRITFARAGSRRVVTTNREGRYSATLAPGLYRVTGAGLVRRGLDAVRVRSGKHLVLDLRVGTPDDQASERSSS
jgi:hypothetical protein